MVHPHYQISDDEYLATYCIAPESWVLSITELWSKSLDSEQSTSEPPSAIESEVGNLAARDGVRQCLYTSQHPIIGFVSIPSLPRPFVRGAMVLGSGVRCP